MLPLVMDIFVDNRFEICVWNRNSKDWFVQSRFSSFICFFITCNTYMTWKPAEYNIIGVRKESSVHITDITNSKQSTDPESSVRTAMQWIGRPLP